MRRSRETKLLRACVSRAPKCARANITLGINNIFAVLLHIYIYRHVYASFYSARRASRNSFRRVRCFTSFARNTSLSSKYVVLTDAQLVLSFSKLRAGRESATSTYRSSLSPATAQVSVIAQRESVFSLYALRESFVSYVQSGR